ncbi:SET domain-containing protein [Aureococcus anophagefferens]|nr:SET domain-containing protein [Aureococcus anophagefferens]
MLLAPPAAGDGNLAYQYHGVTMRARPIAEVPSVAQLADKCSAAFGGTPWNVGVDVVCYRDGRDSCGWHADDTQGETLVLAVVLESVGGPRRVQLRPKQPPHRAPGGAPKRKKVRRSYAHVGEAPLADGDEELELWVGAGDAYSMDRGVQVGYEHAVPKVPPKDTGVRKRVVAILREGDRKAAGAEAFDDADTGLANASLEPPDRWDFDKLGGRFGHVDGIREGVRANGDGAASLDGAALYSRERLVETGGHNQAQRGVSGSLVRGAESVVVSRQSSRLREADGVSWLRYTSTRRQGAGALHRSLANRDPVRVFRSSNLGGAWAPTKPPEAKEAAVYRYDGLYDVRAAAGAAAARGGRAAAPPPDALRYERAYTFRLERREAGNACSNAAFLACLSAAAGGRAPEPDTFAGCAALPPLDHWAGGDSDDDSGGDAYDGDDETFLKVQRRDDATCALCGAGDDEALGAFLAFADRGAGAGAPKTHVHEACAACSSGVFLDDGGDYCNVLKEVKRGRGMRCAADKACTRRPKLSGATVGCGKKSCKRS